MKEPGADDQRDERLRLFVATSAALDCSHLQAARDMLTLYTLAKWSASSCCTPP